MSSNTNIRSGMRPNGGISALRRERDEMKEHTMRRIESMGLKAPKAWKDELYKNELLKLDIKM